MSASKKTRKTEAASPADPEAASPADPEAPSPSKDWRIGADGRVVISRELNDRWIRAIDRMARPILVEGEDPTTRGLAVKQDPALSPRARDVLYVLADSGTHPNRLMKKDEIAGAIQTDDPGTRNVTGESLKPTLRQLRGHGLVESRDGPCGGFCITEEGQNLVLRLRSGRASG